MFQLIADGVISTNESYWIGLMPKSGASTLSINDIVLVDVPEPSVSTVEDEGTHSLDKFEPQIGFISGSPSVDTTKGVTWKYYFATAPPSTPQVNCSSV